MIKTNLKNNIIITLFFFFSILLMINLVISAKISYYQNQIAVSYEDAALYENSPKTEEIAAKKKIKAAKVDSYYSSKLNAMKNSKIPYVAFVSKNQGISTLISGVAFIYLILVIFANNGSKKIKNKKGGQAYETKLR